MVDEKKYQAIFQGRGTAVKGTGVIPTLRGKSATGLDPWSSYCFLIGLGVVCVCLGVTEG